MRFDQIKILSRDAGSLATFYRMALDCRLLSPVHDFSDETLARGFGMPGVEIRMAWLRLPGSDESPILEVYQFLDEEVQAWRYSPGQGQLAFQVEDVDSAAERIVDAGGSFLGEAVDWDTPSGNQARFVLMQDPEGNMIDLWARLE